MERARSEWLRRLGFEQDALMDRYGIVFAVQSAQLQFIRPGRFNDLLYVSTAGIRRGRASLTLDQYVVRATGEDQARAFLEARGGPAVQREGAAEALCRGIIKVACLTTPAMRPCRIPGEIETELRREH